MLKKYLQILSESLDKKLDILTEIEKLSKDQAELISKEGSFEAIDAYMDSKAELIDKINRMDDGFSAMYENIKTELADKKDEYREELAELKSKITSVMEKSTSIEAIEARNKTAMEKRFAVEHKACSDKMAQASTVMGYYNVANKLNVITPQFLDSKK